MTQDENLIIEKTEAAAVIPLSNTLYDNYMPYAIA